MVPRLEIKSVRYFVLVRVHRLSVSLLVRYETKKEVAVSQSS